jgi:hypothetical protein
MLPPSGLLGRWPAGIVTNHRRQLGEDEGLEGSVLMMRCSHVSPKHRADFFEKLCAAATTNATSDFGRPKQVAVNVQ